MLKHWRGDLHIHTCLSPCADLTMSPKRIVEKAVEKHLDFIAVCDHNSAENVKAAQAAGKINNLAVLPGMEVTSIEEVHFLALFDRSAPALKLQEIVYNHLPPEKNKAHIFGRQIIANERDEVEGYNKRLLSAAVSLTLKELVDVVHRLGGLAVASHVDREVYGIFGQLGFIPDDLELDALEISSFMEPAQAVVEFPGIERFPLISSSDAHYLEDIGERFSTFLMEAPSLVEIRKAFKKQEGRSLAGLMEF